jgi:hypothetical protein
VAITHLEVLVEERSMNVALETLMPKILSGVSFNFRVFDGKHDLLRNLEPRLKAYSAMFRTGWKDAGVVVLVDEDREECLALKAKLDLAAKKVGLGTFSSPVRGKVHVLNRIAVEELESWFFGDPGALIAAYPKLKPRSFSQSALRSPDAINGGTWEALERVLNKHGYHLGGLRKTVCATEVSIHMNVEQNKSPSFAQFRDGLSRLAGAEEQAKIRKSRKK